MTSRVEISKRLVLINSASAGVARIIDVSVLVWLHQYLLRRVGPEEYSLLPVLTGVIMLLPVITTVLTGGLGRFVVEAYAKGDDRHVTQIVSTMFPILLVTGAIILAAGLVFSWYVDRVLSIPADRLWDARIMMGLLMLSVASRPPCSVFTLGLFVLQKFVLHNLLRVCGEVFRLLLLFILLFGVGARVLWVVVANVAAELAMTLVFAMISRRLIPALRFRVSEIQWARARELVSFGVWNFLSQLAVCLRQTVVPLILNRLATPLDVTTYHIGFLPRRQLESWSSVLVTPLYPVVTGMHAMGTKERIRNIYIRGGRIALWGMLVVAVPAAIYSRTLIGLYIGNEFMDAAAVMGLSLACVAVSGGTQMIGQVAGATGRVRLTGIRSLALQLITLALTYYLVRELGWGAIGAAFAAFIVGAIGTSLTLWPLGLKLADVKFSTWMRQAMVPGLTPGCVAAVVWVALGIVLNPDSWAELGLCTGLGILCYMAILLGFCLEPRDKEDLATILTGVRNWMRGLPLAGGLWQADEIGGLESDCSVRASVEPAPGEDGNSRVDRCQVDQPSDDCTGA